MKTVLKNISFCLFSLFLITNIFMFTSCGNGNRNDEPIEKEDQCTYCQDEQYDNSCIDGSECNGKEIKYTHLLGNGNYQCRNFMVETNKSLADDNVPIYINEAKNYVNNLVNKLKQASQGTTYFNEYINKMNGINYVVDNSTGIDFVINQINDYSLPVCVDIVKNISSPINQNRMIRCYEAMTIQAKKEGYGDNFNTDAQEEYEENKSWVIENWQGLHNVTGTQQPFDLGADMDNGFTQITEGMDTLLAEAAGNMGNGITVEALRHAINISLNVESLDAIHDYYKRALSAHKSCIPSELGDIVEAMDEAAPLN